MDPMMIVAMVVASVVTHAWERGRVSATARWQAAKAARDQRDQARRARSTARAARVSAARATGPRDLLWWPYAVGFVLAGTGRAVVAAGQGAAEGARTGAAEGRRFGRASAERGWTLRRAWQEYQHRRAASAPAGERGTTGREETVVEPCPACGVYTAHLVPDQELGRVCEPCAQWRAGGEQPPEKEQPDTEDPTPSHDPRCSHGLIAGYRGCPDCMAHLRHEGHSGTDEQLEALLIDGYDARETCDRCTNSDIGPEEARAHGLCAGCGGRRELVWNFGTEHGHTPCRECNLGGLGWTRPRVWTGEVAQGHPDPDGDASDPSWLSPDAARWSPEIAADVCDVGDGHASATNPDAPWHLVRVHWPDGSTHDDAIRGHDRADAEVNAWWNWSAGPVKATGIDYLGLHPETGRYRVPALHDNQSGGTVMTTPLTAQGTGEGYADTVTTLQTLARQLVAAHETAQRLGEQLTADELDSDTLVRVADLMDTLDTVAPLAEDTAKHVQRRHEPVAEAVTSAGGSTNVARRAWYDDH